MKDNCALDFRVEAFNVFNHPNFGNIDGNLTDSTFGQALAVQTLGAQGYYGSLYQTGLPRSLQLSLKFRF